MEDAMARPPFSCTSSSHPAIGWAGSPHEQLPPLTGLAVTHPAMKEYGETALVLRCLALWHRNG
jgi:hypothetical protein